VQGELGLVEGVHPQHYLEPPTMPLLRPIAALLLIASSCAAQEPLFQLTVRGEQIEGTALLFNEQQILFLTRSGKLLDFAPQEATKYSRLNGTFQSYSAAEIRGQLLREFGNGFEVSGGGRFLVVHPAGQQDVWAPRFEALQRSFAHYFAARGLKVPDSRFPLVAIVFSRHADFARYANAEGNSASAGMLGYYSPITNRIVMYDTTAGQAKTTSADWTTNAETIIHEALHQMAFNTGLHNRFGQTPRWVAEGLGTLFEARGVWNSRQYPAAADRVNRGQLASFRSYLTRRKQSAISDLISSDRMFLTDVQGAYAEAWALTWYLSETEPKKYFDYLKRTAAIKSFEPYTGSQRLQDFTAIFGSNFEMLNARLLRYVEGVK
jgi:hypothetical protein